MAGKTDPEVVRICDHDTVDVFSSQAVLGVPAFKFSVAIADQTIGGGADPNASRRVTVDANRGATRPICSLVENRPICSALVGSGVAASALTST